LGGIARRSSGCYAGFGASLKPPTKAKQGGPRPLGGLWFRECTPLVNLSEFVR
jgi:hypothetical protein